MKKAYINKNFKPATLTLIEQANEIIAEFQADDFVLTLRQLYYQLVSRDIISNNLREYKKLGNVVGDGRMAGLIDWSAIEDRTRNIAELSHWTDPGEIIRSASYSFRLDHWEGQPERPEVWIEKEALVGVIEPVCQELDIAYFACKGYVSLSEMWRSAQRFQWANGPNQKTVIFYFGDYDPSGLDMDRDIKDRQNVFGANIEFKRIALNFDQIEKYNPPPNPTKLTDSRAGAYMDEFGDDCWELDALDPHTIADLIREEVLLRRDDDILEGILAQETEYKAVLKRVEENWREL